MDTSFLSQFDTISQWVVGILGPLAILLVAFKKRWGFIIGLFAQPFWFVVLRNDTGGLVAVVAYTLSWMLGIYEWFFKKKIEKPELVETIEGLRVLTKEDMARMDKETDKFLKKQ